MNSANASMRLPGAVAIAGEIGDVVERPCLADAAALGGVPTAILRTVPLTPMSGIESDMPSDVRVPRSQRSSAATSRGEERSQRSRPEPSWMVGRRPNGLTSEITRARADAAPWFEPHPQLLRQHLGEQVIGGNVHQPHHRPHRRRATWRARARGAAPCRGRAMHSPRLRRAQLFAELARGECGREAIAGGAMVVGQRR